MRVEVVTMWYNEAFLAPFFLSHWCWVDKITILLDTDTNDNTQQEIDDFLERHDWEYYVVVRPFTFPDGMDDILKVQRINDFAAQEANCDWLISVDADELAWHPDLKERAFLDRVSGEGYNMVRARLFQVYRHKTDQDLDPYKWAAPQRRHGDPNMNDSLNRMYIKPIIVKPETGITWSPGCHGYMPNPAIKESPELWFGAHWANADPCFCVERRTKGRRDRMSKRNLQLGLTYQHHHVTEAEILELCRRHENDPQLF